MMARGTAGTLARNAGALYGVQFASYLVPLLEIPILARALGPGLYGQILFCQALALSASVVAEYGFNLNATQQAAVQNDRKALARLFGEVLGARTLLALPMIAALMVAWWLGWGGTMLADPWLVPFVLAYFVAFGYSPMWYFQGVERMSGPAALDVALRLMGVAVLALWVRGPADFHTALWILVVPPLLNTTLTLGWAWREVGRIRWAWRGAARQLWDGFHFFVYRGAASLALAAVPVALGVAAGQRAVGLFAPAEKLIRGMVSLAQPLLMALYPACARLVGRGGMLAYGAGLRLVAVLGALALVGALAGAWLGPWVLHAMLGPGFDEAFVVFGWLLALVPLRILNQSMALVLLIPAGRARHASYAISVFSGAGVLLGAGLALMVGAWGMAVGLLAGEALLFATLAALSMRLRTALATAPVGTADRAGMRILLVSTGLNMGGAERQVVDLADSLASLGHQVAIAYLAEGVTLRPSDRRVQLYPMHCSRSPLSLLGAYGRLASLVYRWRPDVVHSHMVHANLMTRLVRLAAPMPRLVCTAHSNREGGRLVMWAYRLTDGLADVTTHVSDEAAREYEQVGAVPAGGIVTVYNGIDVARFSGEFGADARRGQVRPGRRLVLAVGRLVPEKNQAALLRAFALIADQHGDTDLWIVGEGPLRPDLEALRTELGLGARVRFLGQRDDVPGLMQAADLLVLCSQVEGFGLVVAEAMASGTLVVATDVGGVAEVMGDHGALVPPGDVAALARAMIQALALDPAEVARRTSHNRDYVARRFDIRHLVDQWLRIYRRDR